LKKIAWAYRVQAAIEPARLTIVNEHTPRAAHLEFLLRANPFIQSGHAQIFLRGLHAGLMGDMMMAVHLLVPQLENALRFVLNQRGIDTATIDSEGLEQNKALGKLLEFAELRELLGDDLIFELRGVFCEQSGYNFRNRLAHGRVSATDCSSVAAINTWWLILRICCVFYLMVRGEKKQTQRTLADKAHFIWRTVAHIRIRSRAGRRSVSTLCKTCWQNAQFVCNLRSHGQGKPMIFHGDFGAAVFT